MAAPILQIIGLLFVILLSSTCNSQSGCDVESCTTLCPNGQYYSSPNVSSQCCSLSCDDDTSLESGSSGFENCLPCDRSCERCYGPSSDQCHMCNGPYIVLTSGSMTEDNSVICESNYIRNTSLDIVQCLTTCPVGSDQDVTTMECTCRNGYYQNGSICIECVMYNDTCIDSCPTGMYNVSGVCKPPGESRLGLSTDTIIIIIACISAVLVIVIILAIGFVCCYMCKKNYKIKYRIDDDYRGQPVTTSESFKRVTRVTRNISLLRNKNKTPTIEATNSHYLQDLRSSYDPYRGREDTVLQTEVETPLLSRNESVYVKMSPANSLENLDNTDQLNTAIPREHRKVGPSLSCPQDQKQAKNNPSQGYNTLPPVGSYQEHYVDPGELTMNMDPVDYEEYREVYEEMSGGGGANGEVYMNFSSQQNDNYGGNEDEEQYMYEDLSGNFTSNDAPIIPPRQVLPVNPKPLPPKGQSLPPRKQKDPTPPGIPPKPKLTSSKPDPRRETLDNQYVVMNKMAIRKQVQSSSELLEDPKYVNVARDNIRLRSVTSPSIDPPPSHHHNDADVDQQEEYVEFEFSRDGIAVDDEPVYM